MSDTQLSDAPASASVPNSTPAQTNPVTPTVPQNPSSGTVFQFIKPTPLPVEEHVVEEPVVETPPIVQPTLPEQAPISGSAKEAGPIPQAVDTTKWVEASEPEEIDLPKEAVDMGLQSVSQMPVIPEEVRKAGVTYSPPIIPVSATHNDRTIDLTMTEEEKKVLKHPNPSSSLYWLVLTKLRQIAWFKHNSSEEKV